MKYALLALLLVAFNASATNKPNPPNDCGNHGNNCQPSGGSNEANSNANATGGNGTGAGIGVGVGGDSDANSTSVSQGGAGGAGGHGGSGGHGGLGVGTGGDASAGVIGSGNSRNQNTAKGGSAHQSQGQSLNSANLLRMTSENTVNASSANSNNSQASGNTTVTNVGGDSTVVERNAPPVFLGAIMPSSCGGSIQAGASDRNGSGAFGFSWVGDECAIRMIGDRYQQLGMVDTACEVYRSTKAFQKAAKRNPKLASLDCSVKPSPAPVVVPTPPVAFPITDRKPRG